MSTDDSTNMPGSPSPIQDRAKHDLGSATETARRDHDATDKAKTFASEQKDLAAGQISGVASAINKVADELDGGDQQMVARYARDLASGLSKFGGTVQNKNVDDLMGMAQNFGRSQPLAFLGAAALAGFVASRFALASAHRRDKAQSMNGQYSGNQSNNYTGNSTAYGAGSASGAGASSSTGYGAGSSVGGNSSYSDGSGSSSSRNYGASSSSGLGGSSNQSGE